MPDPIRLFSSARCPYAQRTRILLGEKGLEFEQREVDLDAPDDEFLAVSPYGKVPYLAHEEARIWESTVINEYLDERFPAPPMMPADPARRAWLRDWIDHANSELAPRFYKLLSAQGADRRGRARAALGEALEFIEEVALASPMAGLYLLGDQLSLADIAYYPFFERLPAVAEHRGFEWPDKCVRLDAWQARMAIRPAVAATARPASYHVRNYARYASGDADLDKSLSTRDR